MSHGFKSIECGACSKHRYMLSRTEVLWVKSHFHDTKYTCPAKDLVSLLMNELSWTFHDLTLECLVDCSFWTKKIVIDTGKCFALEKADKCGSDVWFNICAFPTTQILGVFPLGILVFCFWVILKDPCLITSDYFSQKGGSWNTQQPSSLVLLTNAVPVEHLRQIHNEMNHRSHVKLYKHVILHVTTHQFCHLVHK